MDDFMKELEQLGCNMQSTLSRFLDDRDFYVECYTEMLADEGFARLGRELQAENMEAAFKTAHMLKGMIANMGLESMGTHIGKLVEALRTQQRSCAELMPGYEELMAEKAKYDALVEKYSL
ncbi:MAG: Hpt domain-containing protein [Lachnospiraceae bacterium]|nr:Hpt domain-containing protein [Lachnospiraceae bacterium]